ncbi:MAG: DNA polymerase III subunit alpha, partial [Candidatus Adiutrix sp.]|nr:DNA polymerase III subunit alpha [Candidatus Adiutrix sp.]
LKLLKKKGVEVDFKSQDFNDGQTYALLARGDSSGVFQLESSGIREYLVKLKPNCLEDLMALVALYRPGPLQSGLADQFIEVRRGLKPAVYDLPQLEPILKETGGVILYQEQVIRLSQVLANFSLGEADLLRRAMGKKDPKEFAKQKARFMAGAQANGIKEKKAEHIFNLIDKFAGYGFNKSHSAAYAVLTYQTAYLKANHPLEFMAALLTSEQSNQDKVNRLISECRAAGIHILPPDVNESGSRFTVADGAVRFGLGAVKGLGEAAIDSIIEAREKAGPFTSLYDFCERVGTQKVNHRVLETLIKCGAFDRSGGTHRAGLCLAADEALAAGARLQRDRLHGQTSMFDILDATAPDSKAAEPADLRWPQAEPWPENKRLAFEKEALGFFITGHPLDRYEAELSLMGIVPVEKVRNKGDRTEVRLGGMVAALQKKRSKKSGQDYGQLTLEDQTGSLEVLVLGKVWDKNADWLKKDEVAVVAGTMEKEEAREAGGGHKEGQGGQVNIKIIAREIMSLAEALEKRTESLTLRLPRSGLGPETLSLLKEAARDYPGPARVYLHLSGPEGVAVYRLEAGLRPCPALTDRLRTHLSGFGVRGGSQVQGSLSRSLV